MRLKQGKSIEVLGKKQRFNPGDWVEVGKQTAMIWIAKGEAESPQLSKRVRVSEAVASVPRGAAALETLQALHRTHEVGRIPQSVTDMTFTIFAAPMAFRDAVGIKQNNAIGSWSRLSPPPIIFLFGNEQGIIEACARHGCIPMPRIKRDEYGTPLIGDAFAQMQRLCTKDDIIVYINSDIIVLQDFVGTLINVSRRFENFLMVGRRWDVDIAYPLGLNDAGWQKTLRETVAKHGEKHNVGAIDYFAFRPGLYAEIPDFAIGRSCWDNWLVLDVLKREIPVIDATACATIVHQDRTLPPPILTEARIEQRRRNREFYDAARESIKDPRGKVNETQWVMLPGGDLRMREK